MHTPECPVNTYSSATDTATSCTSCPGGTGTRGVAGRSSASSCTCGSGFLRHSNDACYLPYSFRLTNGTSATAMATLHGVYQRNSAVLDPIVFTRNASLSGDASPKATVHLVHSDRAGGQWVLLPILAKEEERYAFSSAASTRGTQQQSSPAGSNLGWRVYNATSDEFELDAGLAAADLTFDGEPAELRGGDECPSDPAKKARGLCGCGVPETDSDGDGSPDCIDECPSDGGKTSPGECGCGESDADVDGDGAVACKDACPSDASKAADGGACGCGVSDNDSDSDGTPDACGDACPSDANKVAPGACGCGATEASCAETGTCQDAVTNGAESDVDCGHTDGGCSLCPESMRCASSANCEGHESGDVVCARVDGDTPSAASPGRCTAKRSAKRGVWVFLSIVLRGPDATMHVWSWKGVLRRRLARLLAAAAGAAHWGESSVHVYFTLVQTTNSIEVLCCVCLLFVVAPCHASLGSGNTPHTYTTGECLH